MVHERKLMPLINVALANKNSCRCVFQSTLKGNKEG